MQAESVARDAVRASREVLPVGNENRSSSLVFLGLALVGQNRGAEAEPLLRECLEAREEALPAGRWEVAQTRSALGMAVADAGRFEEAEPLLLKGYEEMSAASGVPLLRRKNAAARLVTLYESWAGTDLGADKTAAAETWRAELGRLQ